jgi:hypothetical protein
MQSQEIPYIESTEALTRFAKHPGVSVVLAGLGDSNSPLNTFPKDLAQEISAGTPDVRMALAAPSVLTGIVSGQIGVGYHDGFIFVDGELKWHTPLPADLGALIPEAVSYFVSSLFNQEGYHLKRKYSDISTHTRLLAAERLLKTTRSRSTQPKKSAAANPYEVLGLPLNCTWEQVRKARNELLSQYHPDKVAAMGPKLREVAESETKKINVAFDQLERKLRPSKKR